MRNLRHHSGVYSNMLRLSFLLICCVSALAQPFAQREPLDLTIQKSWQARNENRPDDFATAREEARTLLQNARMDSPRYQGWVQQVASLYQSSGLNRQAREILQGALARTAPLGPNDPLHVAMETALGEAWLQDGNLLKALSYLEQAAAAQAAAPLPAPTQQSAQRTAFMTTGAFGRFNGGNFNQAIYAYSRLADLYRQLGRPDSVAAVTAKIVTLAATDQASLARFYDQRGQYAEAAAIYRTLAEQATDPQAKVDAWQSLASVDERQELFPEAASAMKEAIAAAEASGNPQRGAQTVWMRQSLANNLRQAGQTDQADQVYSQLLQESGSGPQAAQMLNAYVQYLANTNRAAQAEGILQEHLDGNPGLEPQQKTMFLYSLADLSRRRGDTKAAGTYQTQAQALQPQPPHPAGQITISDDVQKAQAALTQHRLDDAFALAGRVLDTAPFAADGQQVQWFIPQAAAQLASQQPARGEQLYQRLFALAETWKPNSAQALITTSQNYAQFLMNQTDRLSEVPNAIERYRDLLVEQNGSDSASVLQALRMKLEFERVHDQRQQAESSAHDLLEAQEALSGNTSEPYLRDLQTAARAYGAAGDSATAAGLLREAVKIADLISTPRNDWYRTQARMEAAWAVANQKQYDEAETLAQEAVALARVQPHAPQLQNFSAQLEQIRQMKRSAATSAQR